VRPIDLGVVAHHRLDWAHAELAELGDRALEAAGVGLGVLVRLLLDVHVAGVVVDDDVQVDPADVTVALRAPAR
jgi:hypothetical protein